MKNYISIIKYSPNPVRDEFIGVGLILVTSEGKQIIRFSSTRINKVCKLFSIKNDSALLKSAIEGIENSKFTVEYLSYLSVYENGIIRYTKPQPVNSTDPDKIFEKMYSYFIADQSEDSLTNNTKSSGFNQKLRAQLRGDSVIKKHFNVDFIVKPSIVNDLISHATKIDYIGVNGTIYCGKTPNLADEDAVSKTILLFDAFCETYDRLKKFDRKNFQVIINEEDNKQKGVKESIEALKKWSYSKKFTLTSVQNTKSFILGLRAQAEQKEIRHFDEWWKENQNS